MGNINLHLGDCMEAMSKMPDNAYDLAIVDPPYGIGESKKQRSVSARNDSRWQNRQTNWKDYSPKGWDDSIPDITYFCELKRVSNNQIIWGWNYFVAYLDNCPSYIVWDKKNGESDFADCETAWCSKEGAARIFNWMWSGFRKQQPEERIHPTQKPVALYKWLLHNYAKQGDKILDTHGGSMSIAIACHDMNFDLDLWELDPEYYQKGVERFNQHKAQLRMF